MSSGPLELERAQSHILSPYQSPGLLVHKLVRDFEPLSPSALLETLEKHLTSIMIEL